MKKFILGVSLLAVAASSVQANKFKGQSPAILAKQFTAHIKKSLPQKIDFMTTLTGISSKNEFVYIKGILSEDDFKKNNPKAVDLRQIPADKLKALNSKFINGVQKQQRMGLCKDPVMNDLLYSGVKIKYRYYFKSSKKYVGETFITKVSCRKLGIKD